jgi:hypothetical protein
MSMIVPRGKLRFPYVTCKLAFQISVHKTRPTLSIGHTNSVEGSNGWSGTDGSFRAASLDGLKLTRTVMRCFMVRQRTQLRSGGIYYAVCSNGITELFPRYS